MLSAFRQFPQGSFSESRVNFHARTCSKTVLVNCRPRRLAPCLAWTIWSWRPWTGSSCWRPKVTSGAVAGAAVGLAAPTAALPISSSTTTPAALRVPRTLTAATRKTAMPPPPLPSPGADTASTGDEASVLNNRYATEHNLVFEACVCYTPRVGNPIANRQKWRFGHGFFSIQPLCFITCV